MPSMRISYTADSIQKLVQGELSGQVPERISGIASLDLAGPEDLSFLSNLKYREQVKSTKAGLILVASDFDGQPGGNQAFLRVENPSAALAILCEEIERELLPRPTPGVHPMACVEEGACVDPTATVGAFSLIESSAKVGAGAIIGANCTVAAYAEVGAEARLQGNVYIGPYCVIGKHCHLSPGVVIGADGFGYEKVKGEHKKVPQIGRVVLEDYVDIGANSTVDRARFHETRIGYGCKIDNLVQIGHNVLMGKQCLVVSQSGISGSAVLGDRVVLAGQVGVIGHIKIGDNTVITAQSGVNKDIPANKIMRGSPAKDFQSETKLMVMQRRVPELFNRVAKLEELLANQDKE